MTRIMLRPVASPLPLGFFAFGIGLALTSTLDMGLLAPSETRHVALLLLAFVAPLELFAAALAFFARDTAAGTTLGLFGASWVALALSLLATTPGAPNPALGVFLFADAGAMALLAISATAAKPFFSALLTLACARFVLTGLAEVGLGHGLRFAAAIVGWCDTALAFYGAVALLLEDLRHATVLPLFRRRGARTAIEGGVAEQVRELAREAGVREQL
ncbi:MAG TPA: GPR1/FUN34/YaaH family transporter [Polyangiaceae bacterium]|nr:GPR1/FUN34/YaaH family transporter [Polyangiaceae bacterium]